MKSIKEKIDKNTYTITKYSSVGGLKIPSQIETYKDGKLEKTEKFGKAQTKYVGSKIESLIGLNEKLEKKVQTIYKLNKEKLEEKGYSYALFRSSVVNNIAVESKIHKGYNFKPEEKIISSNITKAIKSVTQSDKYVFGKEFTTSGDAKLKNKRYAKNVLKSTKSHVDENGRQVYVLEEIKMQAYGYSTTARFKTLNYNNLEFGGHGSTTDEDGNALEYDLFAYNGTQGENSVYVMITYVGDYNTETRVHYLSAEQYEYYKDKAAK